MSLSTHAFDSVCEVLGVARRGAANRSFVRFSYDSRIISDPSRSCFLAIRGQHHDGHDFIDASYHQGVRCFICEDDGLEERYPDAAFAVVDNVIHALHLLAARHRTLFKAPLIGITGSNGKTIVKEWLAQLLAADLRIVRSPRSYNSQLGVALSLWNMSSSDQLALIEAGISRRDEMARLEAMVRPDIGVFTHVGTAHLEHFDSVQELINEKCLLFKDAQVVYYRWDQPEVREGLQHAGFKGEHITWGSEHSGATFEIVEQRREGDGTFIRLREGEQLYSFTLPFRDAASVANAITAFTVGLKFTSGEGLSARMSDLQGIEMRLERIAGWGRSVILSDVYSNDLNALEISLDELAKIKGVDRRVVILSDILQSGIPDEELYPEVFRQLELHGVERVLTVGVRIRRFCGETTLHTQSFETTEDLMEALETIDLGRAAVLLKGARSFRFERILQRMQQRVHATKLEIQLPALVHNLNHYRSHVRDGVLVMAMVKAFGYGTGGLPVASLLEYHGVDYLGVAYVNEGVSLRKQGIQLPILVLNPDPSSFTQMIDHRLEPEIYSLTQLEAFERALESARYEGQYPVHLIFDTGMHRLGFDKHQAEALFEQLSNFKRIRIKGAMSHFAAADMPEHEVYTRQQIAQFEAFTRRLKEVVGYDFIRHISNTAGLIRYPEAQYEMVRLGIGLYGAESCAEDHGKLQPVAHFLSVVSQLRALDAGESVGYTRAGKADHARTIATVPVGYADGYRRSLSNGKGEVMINGQKAPVVGNVCMDMIMIDVTGLEVSEGDTVVLFGDAPTLEEVAKAADTIPYEILSGISQRVKRIYIQE